MEYLEYRKIGRVFVIRFDEGDDVIKILEDFSRKKKILAGVLTFLGALKKPRLVVGSRTVKGLNKPWWAQGVSNDGYEVLGFGTIFPIIERAEKFSKPSVHIHIASGRKNSATLVGCLRGIGDVHITIECVIYELVPSRRQADRRRRQQKIREFVRSRRSDGVALLTPKSH